MTFYRKKVGDMKFMLGDKKSIIFALLFLCSWTATGEENRSRVLSEMESLKRKVEGLEKTLDLLIIKPLAKEGSCRLLSVSL